MKLVAVGERLEWSRFSCQRDVNRVGFLAVGVGKGLKAGRQNRETRTEGERERERLAGFAIF